jgi:hypothetical protein
MLMSERANMLMSERANEVAVRSVGRKNLQYEAAWRGGLAQKRHQQPAMMKQCLTKAGAGGLETT